MCKMNTQDLRDIHYNRSKMTEVCATLYHSRDLNVVFRQVLSTTLMSVWYDSLGPRRWCHYSEK